MKLSYETLIFAINQLEKKKALPNFGNAGSVLNLLKDAQSNLTSRDPYSSTLKIEDFCCEGKIEERPLEDIFEEMNGCDDIVKKLKGYKKMMLSNKNRSQKQTEGVPFNFLFVGSPGTGNMCFRFYACTISSCMYMLCPLLIYIHFTCACNCREDNCRQKIW